MSYDVPGKLMVAVYSLALARFWGVRISAAPRCRSPSVGTLRNRTDFDLFDTGTNCKAEWILFTVSETTLRVTSWLDRGMVKYAGFATWERLRASEPARAALTRPDGLRSTFYSQGLRHEIVVDEKGFVGGGDAERRCISDRRRWE